MNFVERVKRKYIYLKHKNRKIYKIDSEDVNLKRLKNKILDIDKNIPLGTTVWEENRKELRRAILEDNVYDFLNWSVIKNTMIFEAPKTEYLDVIKNTMLAEALRETKIGNPKPYYLDLSTSGNLIHNAYSVSKLFSKCSLKDFFKVVEFGGGYGSMCRLFRNMNYLNKYIIFDLPEFSALQNFYLDYIGTEFTNNTVFTSNKNDFKSQNSGCLLIATWSLSEMPLILREKLLEQLKFDYCLIAFQSVFDEIDNVDYFNKFKDRYENINFEISPINHLKGHYYLIGY